MNKIIGLVLFTALIIGGCSKSDKIAENKSPDDKSEIKSGSNQEQNKNTSSDKEEITEIKLPTMQCGTCKKNIEGAVKKLDGVNNINVIVKEKIAKVNYDKSKINLEKIEGAIVMAGYQANDRPADKNAYDKLEACCKVGGH